MSQCTAMLLYLGNAGSNESFQVRWMTLKANPSGQFCFSALTVVGKSFGALPLYLMKSQVVFVYYSAPFLANVCGISHRHKANLDPDAKNLLFSFKKNIDKHLEYGPCKGMQLSD